MQVVFFVCVCFCVLICILCVFFLRQVCRGCMLHPPPPPKRTINIFPTFFLLQSVAKCVKCVYFLCLFVIICVSLSRFRCSALPPLPRLRATQVPRAHRAESPVSTPPSTPKYTMLPKTNYEIPSRLSDLRQQQRTRSPQN